MPHRYHDYVSFPSSHSTKKKQKKVATAQKLKEQTTPTTFTTTSTIITTTSTTDTTASTTATTTIIKKKHDKGKKSSTMSKASDWDDYDKHIVQFLNYCYGKDWYERRPGPKAGKSLKNSTLIGPNSRVTEFHGKRGELPGASNNAIRINNNGPF